MYSVLLLKELAMSRLFVFLLGAVTCISMCQCFRLRPSETNVLLHHPHSKSMRIINGDIADIQKFPYMVSLQYNGTFYGHDYDHFCCGSILNNKWIITSAQCGQARDVDNFHVRVGSPKYYEDGVVHYVEKVVIHPNFNEISRDYDVALLKLRKEIIYTDNIKSINLPKANEVIEENTNFSIAGWGATKLLGKISDNLLQSHIQKISDVECQSIYGNGVTDRMFCVFTKSYGPCVGDSGSPAVFNDEIIGLASWSYNCAYEYPTVYAKLSSVLNWIENVTRIPA